MSSATDDMKPAYARERKAALAESLAKLPTPEGKPFATAFEHGSLLVEIFAPRGVDTQQPHSRDEAYLVIQGTGEFVNGDERMAFAPGDFLFAAAGEVHRFENFSDDFVTWVIFYGPEGGEKGS
jgi:mannose-6-phosphate isomerase-like protein (cupin superfamily)